MANNQYVNKVVYNDSTLIDLTEDTVTPESLLSGYTAHDRSGSPINGAAVIPTKVSDLENDVGYLVETDIVDNLTSGEPMPPSAGCVYNALHTAGTWTAKFYAGSAQLSVTIDSATYKWIGDVVFANIRGTFTSQASGGIYMIIDSGIPGIPRTCALIGMFVVDTTVGALFHSNGTNHSAYFRLYDGNNQQGASVSGKNFEVSFFYTAA